ncbi:MAG: TOBE domain-containing protein, partial [Proteobacteria bacterium]|nr:TOBE domain-containing protein [Pseudomonadota bacterium]
VRPENIRISGDSDGGSVFDLKVNGTVNYGDSVLVIGTVEGQPLRMRMPGTDAGTFSRVSLIVISWRPEDVHLIARHGTVKVNGVDTDLGGS